MTLEMQDDCRNIRLFERKRWWRTMIKSRIEALKRELNRRISEGADFKDVYEISVELDKLILQYYKTRNGDGRLI